MNEMENKNFSVKKKYMFLEKYLISGASPDSGSEFGSVIRQHADGGLISSLQTLETVM